MPSTPLSLHSTMFLLIRTSPQYISNTINPLHSTMFLLILRQLLLIQIICIPLHSTMFLLIQQRHEWTVRERVFTVHNVSINTTYVRECLFFNMSFTFHNVSINTHAPHSPIIHRLFYHFLSTLSFTIILYTK